VDKNREQRGLELAATKKLSQKGPLWIVPSSVNGSYVVDPQEETCTCPDHETRGVKCKHMYAVEFVVSQEIRPDGTKIVSQAVRVSFRQEWTAYNAAQTNEKTRFLELLRGLCDGISSPPQAKGRPRLPLADVVFSACVKVYSTRSGRRATGELRDCQEQGHVAKAPHYNSISNYLEQPTLTPILKALVEESAAPLKTMETTFAVDSSGFSTCTFTRWYDKKYGQLSDERQWVKAHLMVGTYTHIVTGVEITDGYAGDSPQLPPLVESTAKRFAISEVSADKAYLTRRCVEAIHAVGATPYIPFKSNSTGEGPELWRRMFHYFQFRRENFLAHYHQRSNVETTFSMIKAKFGASLRSKSRTAQVNEVLCKVLCHNICVLINSIYELGIAPTFWSESEDAQKVS